MRVALVAEHVDRRKGGAETSVAEFAARIAASGVEVCCLTSAGEACADGGVEIRPVATGRGPRWWRYKKFLEAAAEVAAREQFDLVHAIVPCMGADIYQPRGGTIPETLARNLALTKPGWRRSLKRLQQNLTLKQRVMLDAERRLLAGADRPVVACVSSYVARQVEGHYGVRGPDVQVIFNGVNPDSADEQACRCDRERLRVEWGFDDDTVLFATVAHNFRLKGVGRFLQAAALLRTSGHRIGLLIAGKGRDAVYRRQARKLGLADAVRWLGPVSDVWPVYHAADVCVLASYYDPCSRVVLEALTAGLPCVTTRYNGAADVIDDGDSGYVVETPDDVAGLADRMRLLLDKDRRRQMGEAGRRLRDKVSMERHAREMLVLYEEVAGGKKI